ncbi:TRAP transporter small permease subunit [Elioraea sp.]|uniref:TRAP transporter small permease subunit n=1 Tax=Elioraea sp. TaxID=2185103 RepID=UPI0021DE52A5|nr:TRAP transporter small permease subunit [Elioraea sp.]GIX09781.1 MAG: C4-dicarboxylate ABC transporter substrate-binding protein [Elioraea sp.]
MDLIAAVTRALDRFTDAVGRAVMWLAVLLVLAQLAVVLLRYGFSTSFIQLQESVIYTHASLFMLGIAYTLLHEGHVRVDILYAEMSPRRCAWIDLVGVIVAIVPFATLVLWTCWPFVAASWRIREGAIAYGGLPFQYLLKSLIPAMALLLLVAAIGHLGRCVLTIAGRRADHRGDAHPAQPA